MILFKATEENRDRIGPSDFDMRTWTIQTDGWYQRETVYYDLDHSEGKTVTERGQLDQDELDRLKTYLEADWHSDLKVMGWDGSAWEFTSYRDGIEDKYKEMDYYDGIEPFQSIITLLTGEEYDEEE